MPCLAVALSEQSRSLLRFARKTRPMAVLPESLQISELCVFDARTGDCDLVIGLNAENPWIRWEPWEDPKHDHHLFEPNIEYIDEVFDNALGITPMDIRKSERIFPCIVDHETLLVDDVTNNAVSFNNAKIRNRRDPLYLDSLELCLKQPMKGIMDHWYKQLLSESQTREARLAHLVKAYEISDY